MRHDQEVLESERHCISYRGLYVLHNCQEGLYLLAFAALTCIPRSNYFGLGNYTLSVRASCPHLSSDTL